MSDRQQTPRRSGRTTAEPIVVNGSHGEGGGALLRTALSMAALTQRPVRVHTVRGAMRRTGLAAEDMAFLHALARSTSADVDGDEPGSREVVFRPTRLPRPIDERFEIGSFEKGSVPGNALVVLESLIPVLARAGGYSRVTVVGETYNENTLTYDAFHRVTLPAHFAQGVYTEPTQVTAGFGWGAKGEVRLEVEPSVVCPIDWRARGRVVQARGVIAVSGLEQGIAERGASRVAGLFAEHGLSGEVEVVGVRSAQPGVFVTVYVQFERGAGVGTAIGQKGLRMEAVVDSAFRNLREWLDTDATVDPFLADQLLLPAALAEGSSAFTTPRVTRRLVTMAWVIRQFLPVPITIKGQEGYPGTVTVER